MPALVRLLGLAVALLAGFVCHSCASRPDFGLDRWEREWLRAQDLNRRAGEVLRRVAVKDRLARDLIEGRLTLTEAASLLKEHLDQSPDSWVLLRKLTRGRSDEERLCRHLLACARYEADDKADVIRRLEAELAAYLERM
jgi:hypothetical protein